MNISSNRNLQLQSICHNIRYKPLDTCKAEQKRGLFYSSQNITKNPKLVVQIVFLKLPLGERKLDKNELNLPLNATCD